MNDSVDSVARGTGDRLLTINEVTEKLAISRRHCYSLMSAGAFRFIRIGQRGRRVPASEINAFIERKLKEETPTAKH